MRTTPTNATILSFGKASADLDSRYVQQTYKRVRSDKKKKPLMMSSFMTYIEPKKYRAEIYCIA